MCCGALPLQFHNQPEGEDWGPATHPRRYRVGCGVFWYLQDWASQEGGGAEPVYREAIPQTN